MAVASAVSKSDAEEGQQVEGAQNSRAADVIESVVGEGGAVSVIIPAFNEADNLEYVLPRIPEWVSEVIVVDDHSTDNTADVARALLSGVRVVTNEGRRGKGAAMSAGIAVATGKIIVVLDADGSEAPEEIPAFVGALVGGADYAKGSRFMQGGGTSDMTWERRAGNAVFVMLVRLLFGGSYSDLCYGYNAFWRDVWPILGADGQGFEIEALMNVRALAHRLKVSEVPSFEAPRVHGRGHLRTFPDGWRVLRTILTERLRRANKSTAPGTAGEVL